MKTVQENLKKGLSLTNYSEEELKYLQKPIGKAIYKNSTKGRPRKQEHEKCKPTDKITCEICGKTYIRSGSAAHKITNYHKLHERMNTKLRKILLD